MFTKNLIRQKKSGVYLILTWLFLFSGANFYMNWILPTNPQSKNKLIKWMWGGFKYSDPTIRLYMAFVYAGIHIFFLFISNNFWTVGNILVNVYPVIVQIYIGFRCYRIIKFKENNYNFVRI